MPRGIQSTPAVEASRANTPGGATAAVDAMGQACLMREALETDARHASLQWQHGRLRSAFHKAVIEENIREAKWQEFAR
ncbi:hypothetical protein NKI38_27520 [Mesorhizobium sp. M0621]|uniref:hypothetical protein n=1 Tax=Mesorhizobium sp. M0621 TaxID=2956974 RepID=UPI0033377F15